ncbi:hypothetical protein DL93DRAFT_2085393 [Clavulina sp. PMI_390]|nr:hypothetical protein DL93DRAFT_2085393 [Clavulina sp. PMI_390]
MGNSVVGQIDTGKHHLPRLRILATCAFELSRFLVARNNAIEEIHWIGPGYVSARIF